MERVYKLYSSLGESEERKTRAEIDLSALRHNYRLLRGIVTAEDPNVRMIAVVKAEAYGHGAPACVSVLLDEGCDFFAVSCIDEAEAVRRVCNEKQKEADILILGYTQPSLAYRIAEYRLIQTLLSESYALLLNNAATASGVTVRAHVAVDTGMNRIGIPAHGEEELSAAVATVLRLRSLSGIQIEGMFTHFARADEEAGGEGDRFTELQAQRYEALRHALEERNAAIPFHHLCNSAAAVRRPQSRANGVRLGILLFGARPSEQILLPLRPVLKLKTVISHLHRLLPGESVSYGGDFTSNTQRLIATLPIGYADGFLRAYSGASVTVETQNGPRVCPIVGRICMDQCMIDVTDTGAREGDTVTFFGNTPEELSAYANRAQTVDYECLCLLSSRVPRLYYDQEVHKEIYP
ncbi:MAG: alanine racemase [Ruminococcaceae bacterium]|nr:alanine racemase [Oscillospiraceae bacterium]